MAPVTQQSWTRKEICRVLSLEERQLRNWEKQGLISSADNYAFSDLLTLRTLNSLREQKIPARRIRQSFQSLHEPLRRLADNIHCGGRVGIVTWKKSIFARTVERQWKKLVITAKIEKNLAVINL